MGGLSEILRDYFPSRGTRSRLAPASRTIQIVTTETSRNPVTALFQNMNHCHSHPERPAGCRYMSLIWSRQPGTVFHQEYAPTHFIRLMVRVIIERVICMVLRLASYECWASCVSMISIIEFTLDTFTYPFASAAGWEGS